MQLPGIPASAHRVLHVYVQLQTRHGAVGCAAQHGLTIVYLVHQRQRPP
jgi:hypothetical protein